MTSSPEIRFNSRRFGVLSNVSVSPLKIDPATRPITYSMDTGQILADILVAGEMRIHLIGVAGSGMSGIAGLLLALGHRVSGSDKVATIETDRLRGLGLQFSCPHTAEAVRLVVSDVAGLDGGGEDDDVRVAHSVRGVRTGELQAEPAQPFGFDAGDFVRAADAMAKREEQAGNAAHSGPRDAD